MYAFETRAVRGIPSGRWDIAIEGFSEKEREFTVK
jgi:hypothetical protein